MDRSDSPDITNIRPRQVENVVLHVLEDEMVLYAPSSEVVLAVNNSARAVWELCDGSNTILEISNLLGERIDQPGGESFDSLLSDVGSAVFQFHQYGYLTFEET